MQTRRLFALAAMIAIAWTSACGRSESPSPQASAPPASAPKSPIGFLNTPVENDAVASGTYVSGWALAESGIADVSVVFDDGQKPYVKTGVDFPGVKTQFPSYPDADKAGYIFAIPKMSPGRHSLTVTVKARDGGTAEIQRHFQVT